MAVQVPNNSNFSVASAYGTSSTVSAASNASECVLTIAAGTFAVGDLVEFTSGWTRANMRIFRVKTATSTAVTLEGFDTTSTKVFPAGGGAGAIRKISTWTSIPFMKAFEVSGGDPKYGTEEFLDTPDEISIPNGFTATSVTMTIADDPSLPHNAVLQAATDATAVAAVRVVLPSGAQLLYNGTVGFNPNPVMGKGAAMTVKCGLALQGRVVRYAS